MKTRVSDRRGMTLIELLTAVFIMVLMIGSFNLILQSSSRVVNSSQQIMRFNTATSTFLRNLQNDLAKVSPENGFLCITQTATGEPVLMMLCSGPSQSRFFNSLASGDNVPKGNGKLVVVGLGDNFLAKQRAVEAGTPLNEAPSVLYYQPWALTTSWPASIPPNPLATWDPNDILPYYTMGGNIQFLDVNYYLTFGRQLFNTLVNTVSDKITPPAYVPNTPPDYGYVAGRSFRLPAETVKDIKPLWQSVSEKCHWMSIQWTDGSLDINNDQLNWYGPYYDLDPGNIGTTFQTMTETHKTPIFTTFNSTDDTQTEFFDPPSVPYRALWTKDTPSDLWPKAIRIRFALKKSEGAASSAGNLEIYEIICPVGGGF
jgi:type II secretory pathway pseudopilin PulG